LTTIDADTSVLAAVDFATSALQTSSEALLTTIDADTSVLAAVDFATSALQTSSEALLTTIDADTSVLAAVDFATSALQTSSEALLTTIDADTSVLAAVDFATSALQTSSEALLTTIDADTSVLAAVDFATSALQTSSEALLTTIDADTSALAAVDFATETTLSQLNNKLTVVNTDEIKVSDESLYNVTVDLFDRLAPRNSFGLSYNSTITADKYVLLIDVNNSAYPHTSPLADTQGDVIEIDKLHIKFRFSASGASAVLKIKLGVITRVDATDSDIRWILNVPVRNGDDSYKDDYHTPLRFQATQDVHELTAAPFSVMTNDTELAVTGVNTATTLENMTGTTQAPAVGDVIAYFDWTDNVDVALMAFYRNVTTP
jgi:hypothetical protein